MHLNYVIQIIVSSLLLFKIIHKPENLINIYNEYSNINLIKQIVFCCYLKYILHAFSKDLFKKKDCNIRFKGGGEGKKVKNYFEIDWVLLIFMYVAQKLIVFTLIPLVLNQR